MHAAPGMMLTPNLRLLRLVGRGGMGSVWLAEHLVLGSEVAVKLLSHELSTDEEALERFRREATAVAQLKSPHVVGIHDFGTADGVPYFVMEHLVGEDLSQRLDRVARLPIGIVTAIVVQTCKALARVHELGVVHRDLKPGNIFLTNVDGDLVLKLLDFGVAKTRSSALVLHETSDQAVLGTPMYMSPEQILSPRNVGPASDLYSLAVVIYECLAGKPPFDGETVGALHVAIATGRYTPICGVEPSLPATLDGWFARALASDPKERFASAREMSDAFLVAARGASMSRMPVGAATPARSPLDVMPRAGFAAATIPTPAVPFARPSSPSSALPFIAGILAVLVLLGGILGATRLTKRASASAVAPPVATTAPAESSSVSVAPAASVSVTPTASSERAVVPSEVDAPEATPGPSASAVSPPRASAAPIPAPPTGKARRKNRGF